MTSLSVNLLKGYWNLDLYSWEMHITWVPVTLINLTNDAVKINSASNNNLLLTKCEGCTGEYWPEVMKVRTSLRSVRRKTTKDQYSLVQLEQARLVSYLLYGTQFLIVKCTSGGLHLKMFVLSIHIWNFGKISIFLAFSASFNVKNDNIHTFFSLFWFANFEFAGIAPKQKYTDWTVPWKWSVLQNPDRERTNQSTGIWWRLGLPYNDNYYYLLHSYRWE